MPAVRDVAPHQAHHRKEGMMPYDEEDESRILFEMQCAMEDSARAEAEAASYEQAEAEAHSAGGEA